MPAQPHSGQNVSMTHVLSETVKAVQERHGETAPRRSQRALAAAYLLTGLRPRDGIEAMIASHVVLFHELVLDSSHETLRGEVSQTRRATRANIIAMHKAFSLSLKDLEHHQHR